jgi:hypothetical protein
MMLNSAVQSETVSKIILSKKKTEHKTVSLTRFQLVRMVA